VNLKRMEITEPAPFVLPSSAVILRSPYSGAEVILVGTIHVSKESCREVREVIDHFRPDVVFLELCRAREPLLHEPRESSSSSSSSPPSSQQAPKSSSRSRRSIFEYLLGDYVRKISATMKVTLGQEFRTGNAEAKRIGAKVVLGDRSVHVTVQRAWRGLSLWQKIKLIVWMLRSSSVSKDEIEKLIEDVEKKGLDFISSLLKELDEFPSLSTAILHERDLYMAEHLRRIPAKRMVAVVGKGHIPGIQREWSNPNIDVSSLCKIPQTDYTFWKFGFGIAALSIIGYLVSKRLKR